MSGPLPLGTRVRIIPNSGFDDDASQQYAGQEGVTVDTHACPDVKLDCGRTVTCDPKELVVVDAPVVDAQPTDAKAEKKAAVEKAMAEYWEASRAVDAAYNKVQSLLKP